MMVPGSDLDEATKTDAEKLGRGTLIALRTIDIHAWYAHHLQDAGKTHRSAATSMHYVLLSAANLKPSASDR